MEGILDTIGGLNPAWLYGSLLIAAYVENIVPPVPGDTVVIFGAYLVGLGKIEFLPSLAMTTIGSLAGFMTYYAVGRYFGREYFDGKNFKWFGAKKIDKIDKWFDRWGYFVVIGNRFLAGTRSVVSIFAGFARLNILKVTILAFISSLIWNGLLITAGYYAGKNWQYVKAVVGNYNLIITIFIILALTAGVLIVMKKNRQPVPSEES